MVYGHYIEDTVGDKVFFVEGCSYCQMSTGGLHELSCPIRGISITEELARIKEKSHRLLGTCGSP